MKTLLTNFKLSTLSILILSVICIANVWATDFPANSGTLGLIPDYPALVPCHQTASLINKDVTFTVSGMANTRVADIQIQNLTFSPTHTRGGDITATLIAPDGVTKAVVFGRIGGTLSHVSGTPGDLIGPYSFENNYANDIWVAGANLLIPSGSYRISEAGGNSQVDPAPTLDLVRDTPFNNLTNLNGTWTLRFTDGCNGDQGGVSAVTLSIIQKSANSTPVARVNDRDGDGKSDLTVVRSPNVFLNLEGKTNKNQRELRASDLKSVSGENPSVAPAETLSWWTYYSGSNTFNRTDWGIDGDWQLLEDFDGDGKDDVTAYRVNGAGLNLGAFFSLRSSNNTVFVEAFGTVSDDPRIVGDWDGDGIADVAVYRSGTTLSPQSYFYYLGSKNNPNKNLTAIPFGTATDVSFMGDFDGDGKLDPAVKRNAGGNVGIIYMLKSSNGKVQAIQWGNYNDVVAIGDHDGDGKSDLTVSRNSGSPNGSLKYFYTLAANGKTSGLQWGLPSDWICQGDYDGDGKTDVAVYRPSPTAGQSQFYALSSSTGSLISLNWGSLNDYPVSNWNVH